LTEALNERDEAPDTCKDLVAKAKSAEDEVLKLRTEVDGLKAQLEALQRKEEKNTDELIVKEEEQIRLFPMIFNLGGHLDDLFWLEQSYYLIKMVNE